MDNKLTILITTYNREQRLIRMLESICRQGHYGDYILLIVDNCSPNYDWNIILSSFPKEFVDNIQIERRTYNCGMSCNITSSFLFVKTKWCLYLSDDDEMTANGLDIVFNDIEKYPDCGTIKYTIEGWPKHKEIEIDSIKSFNEYFSEYSPSGDIIYLSMLYNLDALNKYMGMGTTYAYNYVGWLMPMLYALIDGSAKMRLSSQSVIKYVKAESGTGWSRIPVSLGISTFMDAPMNIPYNMKRDLLYCFVRNFPPNVVLRSIADNTEDLKYALYCFHRFYYGMYKPLKNGYAFKFKLWFWVYYSFRMIGINLYSIKDQILAAK